MEPSLAHFLAEHYGAVKTRFPGEGRRKWRLRVAELFWSLSSEQKGAYLASVSTLELISKEGRVDRSRKLNLDGSYPQISQNPLTAESLEDADFNTDEDPSDDISDNAPGIGILLRTDYSDEEAWQAFYAKLQDAESEFASDAAPEGAEADADMNGEASSAAQGAASSSTDAEGDTAMEDEDADADDGDDAAPIFFVINAPPAERAKFAGISNLAALRLLNDVDMRRAPAPPAGTKRVRPPNRLVDHDGWQEVYSGKTVWIYDAKSNQDHGPIFAAITLGLGSSAESRGSPVCISSADSWRARVSHICELQVNLASGAMSIDFGGLDRWDYEERVRNLEEAVKPVS
ncbi:hypothetical protein ONZ51_g8981 [Trametes cubensis]|uniref:Uncharacterized protein n=1 Tax=Trametes cubensis TaxID=1111947 RepID=A0AAD7TM76_9APHY|nr:hypothetical protein ONZ51_g8981 [Trametes cubensis]